MLIFMDVSHILSISLSLRSIVLMTRLGNTLGQFFGQRKNTDCEKLSSSASNLVLFRRRSTGCQWLLLSLLPSPRPPPLPVGGEVDPYRVPRTLPPHCWLHLLPRPPFRSLGPAAGLGAEGVREAEAEVVAGEDYGVCWSSLREERRRRRRVQ